VEGRWKLNGIRPKAYFNKMLKTIKKQFHGGIVGRVPSKLSVRSNYNCKVASGWYGILWYRTIEDCKNGKFVKSSSGVKESIADVRRTEKLQLSVSLSGKIAI